MAAAIDQTTIGSGPNGILFPGWGKRPLRFVVVAVNVVLVPFAGTGFGLNANVVAAGRVPVVLNVMGLGKPPVPSATVMVNVAGVPAGTVTVADCPVAVKSTPTPFRVTVCVPVAASSLSVRVAGPRGPTAPGVMVVFSTQVPPEPATGVAVVQVEVFAIPKSAAFVPEIAGATEKCKAPPPVLVTVMVMGALATPTSCAANVSVFAERFAVGAVTVTAKTGDVDGR
jgi:hypothetical protein